MGAKEKKTLITTHHLVSAAPHISKSWANSSRFCTDNIALLSRACDQGIPKELSLLTLRNNSC